MSNIRKEIIEGIRTYRFLIIFAAFLFFALLDPVLNKLILPSILKSQFAGIDEGMLSQMVISTQVDCVRGYLSDTFEITTLIVTLVLAACIAGEIKNRTLIFPLCSGKKFLSLVLSKLAVYGTVIILSSTASVLIDYYYAGMLFGFELVTIQYVLLAGLSLGLYFVFVFSCVMLFGSLVSRSIAAGLLALVPAYGISIVLPMFGIEKFSPAGLLTIGAQMSAGMGNDLLLPVGITAGVILVLSLLTVIRLESYELARRA